MNRIVFALLTLAPSIALAAPGTYTLMAPIGTLVNESLTSYLQGIVQFIIGAAGILAVIMIVICGMKLIGSPSASGKAEAKECIQNAIFGVLLAIGAWVILYTINPLLLSNSVKLAEVAVVPTTGAPSTVDQTKPTAPGWYFENTTASTKTYMSGGATKESCAAISARVGLDTCFYNLGRNPFSPQDSRGQLCASADADWCVGAKTGVAVALLPCTEVGQRACVNITGLPSVGFIKSLGIPVTITGGTECWLHDQTSCGSSACNGVGNDVFDLAWNGADSDLEIMITADSNKRFTSYAGNYRWLYNGYWFTDAIYTTSGVIAKQRQWHVCKDGLSTWYCNAPESWSRKDRGDFEGVSTCASGAGGGGYTGGGGGGGLGGGGRGASCGIGYVSIGGTPPICLWVGGSGGGGGGGGGIGGGGTITITCGTGYISIGGTPPVCLWVGGSGGGGGGGTTSGCSTQKINNCSLSASASGVSSGSCGVGYTGSCNYSCNNTAWSYLSNSCAPVAPIIITPPPPGPTLPRGIPTLSFAPNGTVTSSEAAAKLANGLVAVPYTVILQRNGNTTALTVDVEACGAGTNCTALVVQDYGLGFTQVAPPPLIGPTNTLSGISTEGVTIPLISKIANRDGVVHAGQNGANGLSERINAYSVDTTPCLARTTSSITKLWTHHIDFKDYGAKNAIDFFGLKPGEALSYKFIVPLGDAGGGIQYNEGTEGAFRPTFMSISSVPCDFDVAKVEVDGSNFNACYQGAVAGNSIPWANINGYLPPSYCRLTKGGTYYFNIRFQDIRRLGVGGTSNYGDSCDRPICGGVIQIIGGTGAQTTGGLYTIKPAPDRKKLTLTFAPNETTARFNVYVADDLVSDGTKTLTMKLGNPSSPALIGTRDTQNLSIADNEPFVLYDNKTPPNAIPDITLNPRSGVELGYSNAGGLFAWQISPTVCNATPAIDTVWYYAINLAPYRTIYDLFTLKPNQAIVYKFVVPLTDSSGGFVYNDGSNATVRPAFMSISKQPCDFDVTKITSRIINNVTSCYQSSTNGNSVNWANIMSVPANMCKVTKGQTYYLNLRFQDVKPRRDEPDRTPVPFTDSCAGTSRELCGGILQVN